MFGSKKIQYYSLARLWIKSTVRRSSFQVVLVKFHGLRGLNVRRFLVLVEHGSLVGPVLILTLGEFASVPRPFVYSIDKRGIRI